MSTQKNLITLCFAAVFTLGLAACGGGGGGGAPVTGTTDIAPPDPIPEDEAAANVVAATAAAATKMTEIAKEAVQGEDAGLGGTDAPAIGADRVDGAYGLSIERDRMATTVTITVQGAAEGDDEEFMQAKDFGDGRTMHTRTMDANEDGDVVTEVVIVSTDIEAPKATKFATEHMFNTNPTAADAADPGVNQSLMVLTANVGMWSSSEFPSTPGTTRDYPADDDATEDVNEAAIDGKFDGADGTFECLSADCSIETDDDGKLETVGGTWRFTPADGATVDVDDADYLHYGFWLMRTTDADGATTYNEVQTFAVSSVDPSGTVAGVDGTAEYNGGAVGVYVKNVFDSKGAIDTATSGHFTADVSLTATFGQTVDNDIAPNLTETLSGTINNFQLAGEEENEWSVNLQSDNELVDGTASGTANGGGVPGTFNATFHGALNNTDPTVQPSSVVGEFNANFGNGTVAGGFGARKK